MTEATDLSFYVCGPKVDLKKWVDYVDVSFSKSNFHDRPIARLPSLIKVVLFLDDRVIYSVDPNGDGTRVFCFDYAGNQLWQLRPHPDNPLGDYELSVYQSGILTVTSGSIFYKLDVETGGLDFFRFETLDEARGGAGPKKIIYTDKKFGLNKFVIHFAIHGDLSNISNVVYEDLVVVQFDIIPNISEKWKLMSGPKLVNTLVTSVAFWNEDFIVLLYDTDRTLRSKNIRKYGHNVRKQGELTYPPNWTIDPQPVPANGFSKMYMTPDERLIAVTDDGVEYEIHPDTGQAWLFK